VSEAALKETWKITQIPDKSVKLGFGRFSFGKQIEFLFYSLPGSRQFLIFEKLNAYSGLQIKEIRVFLIIIILMIHLNIKN